MPTVKRKTTPPVPVAPPAPDAPKRTAEAEETTSSGWVAQPKSRRVGQELSSEATSFVKATTADLKTGPIAPAPLLKALGDGSATVAVPIKAGDYKFKGVSFTVKPGTVAHVNVQVKNGELVPVGRGQQGTSVKIEPPLDLPLWVTGQGVELHGDDAKQHFEVELGGFFDLNFKSQKLSEMVTSGDARPSGQASAAKAAGSPVGDLATQMLDLGSVKVDAKVTMREASLDLGGASVKIDPSTTFQVKGDGQHATVSGHVALDGFALNQGGVQLASTGGGKAELSASIDRGADGYQVDSRLSGVQLSIDGLTSTRPSAAVPGKMDKLTLGPTEIHDGDIRLSSKLGMNGMTPTGLSTGSVELSFKGSGTIEDAQLTMKDAKDSATVELNGKFQGTVGIGPDGVLFDAKVTGAHVDVRDLQETVQGNQVSIERAVADGDVQVTNRPGTLLIDGDVKALDIVVDDFKGGAGGVKADLGLTTVTGAGKFHVGSDGVKAEGRLHGSATIDSASFAATKGQSATLGSSTVSGDLTKLDLGKGAPELRLENVAVDLDVQRAALDVGQANVTGGGHVKGTGNVVLDAKGFSLAGKAQVSMKLDDGRVHSSTVDLSLGKGSGAELAINELSLGKTTKVKVGAGSRLDMVLAGGSLQVGPNTVQLEKGGRAEFKVKNVDVTGKTTDLRGSVKLDAKVKSGDFNFDQVNVPGVKVRPADVKGRVQVTIDDAHLADDRLTFKNAALHLDAQVGRTVGVATPGKPGVGSLQDPVPVVSAADVKKSSAAQLAGIAPSAAVGGSPVEALKLLREGTVTADVPLQGTIHALGMDVVKLPPGARLELQLAVRDGKIVAKDTKASISGGVKAAGVEVLGVHLDDQLHLHADLKVMGQKVSVPVPGIKVPGNMEQLGALAAKTTGSATPAGGGGSAPKGAVSGLFDLSHARLDVSNATFAKGRLAIPGGSIDVAEGSKLSFHGTPMAGELTGSVGLDAVTLARDELALKGSKGRADLRLAYRREGDKAVVDGKLSNLSMSTDYVVRKSDNGDYVSLGKGSMSGASVSLRTVIPVDANGLPKMDGVPAMSDASVSVPNFVGDLKGARMTAPSAVGGGAVQLGPTHLEASVAFTQDKGLTLKGSVDTVDADVSGMKLQQKGNTVDVEHGRFKGTSSTLDIGPNRFAVDAKQLAWDVTVHEVETKQKQASLKTGQVRVTGEGRFSFDSQKDLKVEGKLHVEGSASGTASLAAKSVTVNRKSGVKVQR